MHPYHNRHTHPRPPDLLALRAGHPGLDRYRPRGRGHGLLRREDAHGGLEVLQGEGGGAGEESRGSGEDRGGQARESESRGGW